MIHSGTVYRRSLAGVSLFILLLAGLLLTGCEQAPSNETAATNPTREEPAPTRQQADETAAQKPPQPPITETFDDKPQLSLFPRAGDYRPDENDEKLPYWMTFVDHLIKTSGRVVLDQNAGQHAWALRGIKTIGSVGFFSPLAVEPATRYRVSLRIKTDLTNGASAGVGILEFSEFLWIADQFTEEQMKQFGTGSQEGVRLTGTHNWEEATFEFSTGPDTRMIHLILFREGEADRNPVLFDDISITPLASVEQQSTR